MEILGFKIHVLDILNLLKWTLRVLIKAGKGAREI